MAAASKPTLPALNSALAHTIVEDAIRTYFRKRRSRVPAFVDRTFSFSGALKTHRHALGHDLWRAPLNAAMAGPQLGLNAAAGLLAAPPRLPQGRSDQPGGQRLRGTDVVQPTNQLQPARLHHVGGFLGGQPLGPGHPPQQRVQLGHDLAHRGLIPGPGLLEGCTQQGRAVSRRVALAGLHVPGAGSPATERHSRHVTAAALFPA